MKKEYALNNLLPGSSNIFNNSRIFFSKFDMSGLNDFHDYSSNAEMFKYFEFGPHQNINESIAYIEKIQNRILNGYKGGKAMYWFIRLKESNKVIGSMALVGIDFNKGIGEIGKGLSPEFWGHGYMSEAMDMYLDYCKNTLNLNEIISFTRFDNNPNIKLMNKKGFSEFKRLKSYYKNPNGDKFDAILMNKLL